MSAESWDDEIDSLRRRLYQAGVEGDARAIAEEALEVADLMTNEMSDMGDLIEDLRDKNFNLMAQLYDKRHLHKCGNIGCECVFEDTRGNKCPRCYGL